MPFISAENLIQGYPNIRIETINLIRWFYSQFNNRSAANRTITNVEPLYYSGVIAGSEFLTYAATKLYLTFSLKLVSEASTGVRASTSVINYYNEANAIIGGLSNMAVWWNTTGAAPNFYFNNCENFDMYFSRLVQNTTYYSHMIFNGYRITLV